MILFVSKGHHQRELQRAKLREEMLKGVIESALKELRRASSADPENARDCVLYARSRLSKVLCDVSCI